MPVPTLNPESPVLLPDWPGVRLFCSSRQGGVSAAPFDSLNLGDHVGDDLDHVARNRQRWAAMCGAKPVFLKQVHGVQVLEITPQSADGVEADACWTSSPQLACTIMVADCLPVLFHSPAQQLVAAAHAGWRGLANGVLENTVQAMTQLGGGHDLKVWLGPCIGPSAFEVGEEVRQVFLSAHPQSEQAFKPQAVAGKYLADLPALARWRLADAGVSEIVGNDGSLSWCTFNRADVFFSHRRDGISGRFAAGICLI